MATNKSINPSTVILVLADQSPQGVLTGRTRIQKLVYFLREHLPIAASYTPYYYGPYSEEVTASLDSLVASGLLDEHVESLDTEGPFEGRVYRYTLTSDGHEVLDSLRSGHSGDVARIEKLASTLLKGKPSTATLAVASKLHCVVRRSARPVPEQQLAAQAKRLGWHIAPGEVKKGVKYLLDMGLASTVKVK
jgi:uncharacterized protein YwgA